MNYGFVIDNRKCIGCHACTLACKSEHDVAIGVNRTHVKYVEKGEFPHSTRKFSVHRCNHCEKAPCVEICPTSALFTRADGIVDFDRDRCIGCKSCMQACPYDALYIDPQNHTAAKCNYCTHRVDRGIEPACVIVCPVEAIVSGDLDDPASKISRLVASEAVSVRKPEKGTIPNLYYIEGDTFMLVPTATPTRSDYIWSEQRAGVGHFAEHGTGEIPMHNRPADDRIIGKVARTNGRQDQTAGARVYDVPAKGVLWGWEVPAYIVTKAVATGTFLMAYLFQWATGLLSQRTETGALAITLLFLALTAGLLVKDLDRPDRFFYVLLRPNWKSWLVRGAYIITGFGLVVSLILVFRLTGWPLPGLVPLGGVLAILGAVYTAFLFAQAKGRDLWQSPLSSVHMLLHALMAGAVVLSLFEPGGAMAATMADILALAIPMNLALMALEWFTPHGSADARLATEWILHGRFGRLTAMAVLGGNLLPLALLLSEAKPLIPIAAGLVLVGIYLTEFVRVRVPQLIPLS